MLLATLARINIIREDGATAVEYAIMASLIAAVIVVAVGLLGGGVRELFRETWNALLSIVPG